MNEALGAKGPYCHEDTYCIKLVLRGLPDSTFTHFDAILNESLDRGCMMIGGCRQSIANSFHYHIEHSHSLVFESNNEQYATMQPRLAHIQEHRYYRAKLIGFVATAYEEAEKTWLERTAEDIRDFMANPKHNPSP